MFSKIFVGWMVVTSSYFFTGYAMYRLYEIIFNEPADYNWDLSGTFIGIPLLVIPYLLAGLYTRKVFDNKRSGALWVSIIPVICERLLIFLIGYLLVLSGGDGTMNGVTTMMFIRGEAAPYYTSTYIICGVISILICFIVASYKSRVK